MFHQFVVGSSKKINYLFYADRFGLNCTINKNRTHTVQCESISGVINESEVACVYDSGPMRGKC